MLNKTHSLKHFVYLVGLHICYDILCSIIFLRKSCRLQDVEKYGTSIQATGDNRSRRMRNASWITKAVDTRSQYVILIAFPRKLEEGRDVHKVLVGKPEGKGPLVRPRRRWEDNIKMDLDEVGRGCGDWMELAQDRDS